MALSNFENAHQQFAEYVKLRSSDPSGYCALGMTLAALERSQEARTEFERSIELRPYKLSLTTDSVYWNSSQERLKQHRKTFVGCLIGSRRTHLRWLHWEKSPFSRRTTTKRYPFCNRPSSVTVLCARPILIWALNSPAWGASRSRRNKWKSPLDRSMRKPNIDGQCSEFSTPVSLTRYRPAPRSRLRAGKG